MQAIHIKKFGTVLVSRPEGREAFNAIRPTLDPTKPLSIDFADVLTVGPAWLDEFLTNLADFMNASVEFLPTTNASVLAELPVLSAGRDDAAGRIMKRALEQIQAKDASSKNP